MTSRNHLNSHLAYLFVPAIFAICIQSRICFAQEQPNSNSSSPSEFVFAWNGDELPPKSQSFGAPTAVATNRIGDSGAQKGFRFDGRSWLTLSDDGEKSQWDFANGDELTVGAWVRPDGVVHEQQFYIIGKGRSGSQDYAPHNQNWALRLRGSGSEAKVSFLFRDREAKADDDKGYHRWTSGLGFVPDGNWHFVAIRYRFGAPETISAIVDGRLSTGSWDMGGASKLEPVQDNDAVWIASALGGNPGNTFRGELDNLFVARKLLPAEELQTLYKAARLGSYLDEVANQDLAPNQVTWEIGEGLLDTKNWDIGSPLLVRRFASASLALVDLPRKYSINGMAIDYANPILVRARTNSHFAAGKYNFLLRSKNAARLFVDGNMVASSPFMSRNADGHEPVPNLRETKFPGLHYIPTGHQEIYAEVDLAEGEHLIQVETIVGGKELRVELGELFLAASHSTSPNDFRIVGSSELKWNASEESWGEIERQLLIEQRERNRVERAKIDDGLQDRWELRHAAAREYAARQMEFATEDTKTFADRVARIDRLIEKGLLEVGAERTSLVDDVTFARRLFLDTVGVVPTDSEIRNYLSWPEAERRERLVDTCLADPRWADHWVGYWQDVLGENPGILKPELNNTGPFRFWIYESFLDNKPIDRFASELVLMGGSRYSGSPNGFALATQNDVPFAEKGIILGAAFLGINMACARCHDSPIRDHKQQQLFELAALLNRTQLPLPATSSVVVPEGGRVPAVTVSLKPGTNVAPKWSLPIDGLDELAKVNSEQFKDTREFLAAKITSPENSRFGQVIANRLWHRYFGRGIVHPVDDWDIGQNSNPELLRMLELELLSSGYDLKFVSKLIFMSRTYQSELLPEGSSADQIRLFAGREIQRMTAEQLVDSLFAVSGKPMGAEMMTMDPEGRRPDDTFLNLGTPSRAWQLASTANERDRPALSFPVAQGIVDLMLAFGWRDSRPNSLTIRDHDPQVLQNLLLSNGNAAHRVTQLSDESWFTSAVIESTSSTELLERLFLRTLGRFPTPAEADRYGSLLSEGFADRVIPGSVANKPQASFRNAVSWSNHLSPEATVIKQKLEEEARLGDPPSARIRNEYRERVEDIVWVLLNSPEFVFVR